MNSIPTIDETATTDNCSSIAIDASAVVQDDASCPIISEPSELTIEPTNHTEHTMAQPSDHQSASTELDDAQQEEVDKISNQVDEDQQSSEDESDSSSSQDDSSEEESSICQSEMELSDHEDAKELKVLKTKNEIQELPPVEKIHVEIPVQEPLICVGKVEKIIQDNLIIIAADNSGDYQVLDIDSVLLTADKKPIGKIFEVFGRVIQPLYSIRINGKDEIQDLGLEIDSPVYYIQNLVQMVFTQPLKAQKGSDASNLHDEEIGENELEFSDDEKEAEYKRSLKKRKNQSKDSSKKIGKVENVSYHNHHISSDKQSNASNFQYNYNTQNIYPSAAYNYSQQQIHPAAYNQYLQYQYQMMYSGFHQYSGQHSGYQNNQYSPSFIQSMYPVMYQTGNNVSQQHPLPIVHNISQGQTNQSTTLEKQVESQEDELSLYGK